MSVLLVFHLTRELPIGLVLGLVPDKCAKNHILFVHLIKKLVGTLALHQAIHQLSELLHLVVVCLLLNSLFA